MQQFVRDKAKVANSRDTVFVNQNVARLDIAVDHPARVESAQPKQDLRSRLSRLRQSHWTCFVWRLQRPTSTQLHAVADALAVWAFAQMIHWHDVRVLCGCEVLCLSQELGFGGIPVIVGLILLLRNDFHSNIAMNLINRSMNVAELTATDVISYLDFCDVIIHFDRSQLKA